MCREPRRALGLEPGGDKVQPFEDQPEGTARVVALHNADHRGDAAAAFERCAPRRPLLAHVVDEALRSLSLRGVVRGGAWVGGRVMEVFAASPGRGS